MVDFSDMAAKAKAAVGTRIAETLAGQANEAGERKRIHDSAMAALKEHVLSALERAKSDFAKQDIPAVIKESFDTTPPWISIKCSGPDIPTRGGGKRTPESVVANFVCRDGTEFEVSVTNEPGRVQTTSVGRVEPKLVHPVLVQVLQRVLDSYVDELHRARTER